jgi:hypothetical protein
MQDQQTYKPSFTDEHGLLWIYEPEEIKERDPEFYAALYDDDAFARLSMSLIGALALLVKSPPG